MNEIWKDISGYEGIYQISNFGHVKSLSRFRRKKEKILAHVIDKDGYQTVGLCKNNKVKNHRIHRLVAKAFIANPNNLPQINHKDENKTNNSADNLEWCDSKYNINYGLRTQKVINKICGEKNYRHKITKADVIFIRNNYKFHSKQYNSVKLGEMFGISPGTVRKIIHNERWKI